MRSYSSSSIPNRGSSYQWHYGARLPSSSSSSAQSRVHGCPCVDGREEEGREAETVVAPPSAHRVVGGETLQVVLPRGPRGEPGPRGPAGPRGAEGKVDEALVERVVARFLRRQLLGEESDHGYAEDPRIIHRRPAVLPLPAPLRPFQRMIINPQQHRQHHRQHHSSPPPRPLPTPRYRSRHHHHHPIRSPAPVMTPYSVGEEEYAAEPLGGSFRRVLPIHEDYETADQDAPSGHRLAQDMREDTMEMNRNLAPDQSELFLGSSSDNCCRYLPVRSRGRGGGGRRNLRLSYANQMDADDNNDDDDDNFGMMMMM